MAKIRVLLVDDHAILREGLRAMLGYYQDVEVVGEAQDGLEAVARAAELRPDVVLMDVAMPGMNGIDATRIIHQRYPESRVLVLTQHEDWRYVQPLLQAGAAGYLLKRALGADLIGALRTVARGEPFLYTPVLHTVVDEIQHAAEASSAPGNDLTARETEVLRLVAEGKTNPQIAATLSLSVKTVEWHRGNLMHKLDAHTTADLVRFAVKNGLVSDST